MRDLHTPSPKPESDNVDGTPHKHPRSISIRGFAGCCVEMGLQTEAEAETEAEAGAVAVEQSEPGSFFEGRVRFRIPLQEKAMAHRICEHVASAS